MNRDLHDTRELVTTMEMVCNAMKREIAIDSPVNINTCFGAIRTLRSLIDSLASELMSINREQQETEKNIAIARINAERKIAKEIEEKDQEEKKLLANVATIPKMAKEDRPDRFSF